MARTPRVHYPGAVYHVIARGNNQEYILSSDTDKQNYLGLIMKYKERFQFKLFGYVLMNNHIHLIIEVNDHPLAKIMQGIQQSYTQRYNRQYKRVGHVFQQRYKAIECTKDGYLLTLLKYIHYNPVRAGLSSTPDYTWSSHQLYLKGLEGLVNVEFCLGILDPNFQAARTRYLDFMNQPDSTGIMGSNNTQRTEQVLSMEKKAVENLFVKGETSLKDIVNIVAQRLDVSKEAITSSSRNRKIVTARNVIIYLTLKHKIGNRQELSRELRINEYQISRGYYRAIQNEYSRAIIRELEK